MKIKVYFLTVLVICLLQGCAGPTQWYLNGRTQQQFSMDDAKCTSIASGIYQGQGASSMGEGAALGDSNMLGLGALLSVFEYAEIKAIYNNCMRQHGYTIAQ